MSTVKFELTETQVRNLGAFLDRVTLTSKEVPAFSELITCLNKGIQESQKTPSLFNNEDQPKPTKTVRKKKT